MFGLLFPDKSYPIDVTTFTQIDPLHYLLDLTPFLTQTQLPYHQIKDVCIFLLSPTSIPPDKAVSLYIQPPNTTSFIFCGAVSVSRPSAVLSLPWPDPAEGAAVGTPKIGISVEDLTAVPAAVDTGMEKKVEKMVMRVGENLFNFMQSFCGVDGSRLVVPMDILDQWFKKFQERARRDPEYLKGFSAV